jgi:hypothetical protein
MNRTSTTICVAGSADIDLDPGKAPKGHALLKLLRERGFVLTNDPAASYLLCIDHNSKAYSKFISSGGSPLRAVLLRLEPDVIFPSQYMKSVTSLYTLVLSPGGLPSSRNASDFSLGWGYRLDENPLLPSLNPTKLSYAVAELPIEPSDILSDWHGREIDFSMIASNKVSPISSSNYGLRRRIAGEMSPRSLSLFGNHWEAFSLAKLQHRIGVAKFSLQNGFFPNLGSTYGALFKTYKTFKGPINNKFLVIKKSKFNIVIENSNSCVTEKLFDSLIGGAIPIYHGPKLSEVGIKDEIALELPRGIDTLENLTLTITDEEVVRLRQAGKKFLASSNFENNWSEPGVYSKMLVQVLRVFRLNP